MKNPPLVSFVIAAPSQEHLLSTTFDSLKNQEEKDFEVILLGDEKKEHFERIVKSYPELKLSIFDTKEKNLTALLNQGLHVALGQYVQFLRPGDRFLSQQSLSHLKELIQKKAAPEVVYFGLLVKEKGVSPYALSNPLDLDLLQKDLVPPALKASFFLKKRAVELGGLDLKLKYRAPFDLLCKMFQNKEINVLCSKRVLADFEKENLSFKEKVRFLRETLSVLYHRFGLIYVVKWAFQRNFRQILQRVKYALKEAFFGS